MVLVSSVPVTAFGYICKLFRLAACSISCVAMCLVVQLMVDQLLAARIFQSLWMSMCAYVLFTLAIRHYRSEIAFKKQNAGKPAVEQARRKQCAVVRL